MRRVVYYERVSTENQKERETILMQAEDLAKRLESDPEVTVVDRYIDDGFTGTLDLKDRPEGRRLLEDAAAGRFDEVWMWKLDRIGRDDIDPLVVRRDLNRLGVTLCALHDNIEGTLEYALRVAIAAEERRTFRLRTDAGRNRAAREGRYNGGIVPLGYRVEGKSPHARLVPSDAQMWGELSEADVVRWMYHRLAVGGLSCSKLIAEMNALGIPTAYQKDGRGVRGRATQQIWRPNRAYCLIKNTIYRGELQYGRHHKRPGGREIISAPVARLVSDEIWYAAQDSLRRHNLNPEGKRRIYLLRSLMICNLCGMRYAGVTSPGRDGVYRCNGQLVSRRPELGRCLGKLIKCKLIDEPVWSDIERFLLEPGDLIEELTAEINDVPGAAVYEAECTVLAARLNDLVTQRSTALDLRIRNLMSEEELETALERVEGERREVERRLEAVAGETMRAPRDVVSTDVLSDLRARLAAGLTEHQKQEIAHLLVRRVIVETTVHGPRHKTAKVSVDYAFPCVVGSHTGSRCTPRRSRPSLPTTDSCAPTRRPAGNAARPVRSPASHPRSAPPRTSAPASCTAP